MKVRIDPAKCEGFGACAEAFPEVFRLDEWGFAYAEGDGEIPVGREDDARTAVYACPMNAIRIQEEVAG